MVAVRQKPGERHLTAFLKSSRSCATVFPFWSTAVSAAVPMFLKLSLWARARFASAVRICGEWRPLVSRAWKPSSAFSAANLILSWPNVESVQSRKLGRPRSSERPLLVDSKGLSFADGPVPTGRDCFAENHGQVQTVASWQCFDPVRAKQRSPTKAGRKAPDSGLFLP